MKDKYSILSMIFGALPIVFAISLLVGIADHEIYFPYMFTCLGIGQLFLGLKYYKKNQKGIAFFLFFASGVVLFVTVSVVFMK